MSVSLAVDAHQLSGTVETKTIDKDIQLYGPGDISGFNSRMIVATEPKHNVGDFESNYFPTVQFREPDFPWRYTAATSDGNDNLLPWMTLVVLIAEDRGEVKREFTEQDIVVATDNSENKLLPYIENVSTGNLPDLSESWRWAHTQITSADQLDDAFSAGELAEVVSEIMHENPEQISSRLMCARRLRPGILYNAFLVPTFKLGKLAAGLEVAPEIDATSLAWDNNAVETIRLPYYFRWEFRTSNRRGDFEHLVRELKPRELNEIGQRELDCSNPGLGISGPDRAGDASTKQILNVEGALQSILPKVDKWGFDRGLGNYSPENFQEELAALFNKNAENTQETHDLENYKAKVLPPIYGRWHKARDHVEANRSQADWLDELNLDPRHRSVAGIGAEVVRKQQESLMISAWDQVGRIDEANALLNQAQLAIEASRSVQDRLDDLSEENFFVHTKSILGRLRESGATKSIGNILDRSRIPKAAMGNTLRRIRRPFGPISKRQFRAKGEVNALKDRGLIGRFNGTVSAINDNLFRAAQSLVKPVGTLDFSSVTQALNIRIAGSPTATNFDLTASLNPSLLTGRINKSIAKKLAPMLDTNLQISVGKEEPAFHIELDKMRNRISTKLDPEVVLGKKIQNRIKTSTSLEDKVPDKIMSAPKFDHPMYEPLKQQSMEWLIPGLETIPQNTISLLSTNQRFIESYMVGCNHEFASELLWREYPTDQRGTYFRKFWQTITPPETFREIDKELQLQFDYSNLGTLSQKMKVINQVIKEKAEESGKEDITPIHTWVGDRIGGNAGNSESANEERLVLVIRGDLIKKYPNAVIYAVRGVVQSDDGNVSVKPGLPEYLTSTNTQVPDPSYPIFTAEVGADITLLGFDIPVSEVSSDPGWYFVIEERVSETRFGLDVANNSTLTSCDDIAWDHFDFNGDQSLDTIAHQVDKYLNDLNPLTDFQSGSSFAEWGSNAATIARCTLQKPVRIVVSSTKMIPEKFLP
jgi:hypothetical protein